MQAVLFDHDGTLVDSEVVHYRVWREVSARYGVDLPEQVYRLCHAGVPTLGNARDIIQRYGLSVSVEQLAQEKKQATRLYLATHAFPLMPGVRVVLERLRKAGVRLAVVSGAERYVLQASLRAHDLQACFEFLVGSDDVSQSKPAPECYLLAMARLGLAAEQCLAIEDTEHGLKAALAAGIPCLAVPNEMSAHQDFSGALGRYPDLLAAIDWLEAQGKFVR